MSAIFEGSYLGDDTKLTADTKLECGICWHVYDPAEGDEVWQIEAGTPFSALPEHWRCPVCDAPKHKFMVLGAADPAPALPTETRVAALLDAYRKAALQMVDLPVYNPALSIEAVGFRVHGAHLVGVVITPWFMNLTVIAADPAADPALASGTQRTLHFPSGAYPFVAGPLAGIGTVECCSLFSPMQEFREMAAARIAAESAIEGLFKEDPALAPARHGLADKTRRELLFGAAR